MTSSSSAIQPLSALRTYYGTFKKKLDEVQRYNRKTGEDGSKLTLKSRMGMGAMVQGCGKRNIVIRVNQGDGTSNVIRNIDDSHELYHPLAYVLLFPTGVGGWASWMQRVQ